MGYCKKCGAEIPERAKFCEKCGNPVEVITNKRTKKKLIIGCSIGIVLLSMIVVSLFAVGVFGGKDETVQTSADVKSNQIEQKTPVPTQDIPVSTEELAISAKSVVLIDNNSGQLIYEKNKDMELVPASITKIMTLVLIFDAISQEKISLEDEVSVSEYAFSMGGSQVSVEPQETQTVDTMIKCISMANANDAAVAMAEKIAGSEENFVEMMNERAKGLGMSHTQFKNCTGLDDDIKFGNFSTAYDVALMSRELIMKYPQISDYATVWTNTITHKTKSGETKSDLTNTNKLVRFYDGITGLKTGSTTKAKYCLSATAKREEKNITAVVMAAPDHKASFTEAQMLLNYGFANIG